MREFTIAIEETLVKEFKVMADSAEAAIALAEGKYKTGEFALEPGEVQHRQMAVIAPREETNEWREF